MASRLNYYLINQTRNSCTIFKYYDYVLKARLQKIEQFKSDIKDLTALVETINQKKISLAKKKKNLDAERLLLAKNLDNRTAKVRQLESSLQSSEQKLNTLKRQRSELEQVISTVKSAQRIWLTPCWVAASGKGKYCD